MIRYCSNDRKPLRSVLRLQRCGLQKAAGLGIGRFPAKAMLLSRSFAINVEMNTRSKGRQPPTPLHHGHRTTASNTHSKSMHAKRGPNNVSQAVVIKDEDVFFLSDRAGNVPLGNQQGFGLYYHDCRFLRGYELSMAGVPLNSLASTSEHGFMSEFVLTNPDVKQLDGSALPKQSIGVEWRRIIHAAGLSLQDVITCTNYKHFPLQFVLSFHFEAGFEDVFEIRGLQPKKIGRPQKPSWRKGSLIFKYDGADGLYRTLRINLTPATGSRRKDGVDLKAFVGTQ